MLDSNHPRKHAGFQSGYLTTDYIHVINQVVETYVEYTKMPCMAFIDYEKRLEAIGTSAVMKALRRQVVEEIYVKNL